MWVGLREFVVDALALCVTFEHVKMHGSWNTRSIQKVLATDFSFEIQSVDFILKCIRVINYRTECAQYQFNL